MIIKSKKVIRFETHFNPLSAGSVTKLVTFSHKKFFTIF